MTVCAVSTVLAACASTPADGYPSLAIRDAERWSGSIEAPPYEPPAPAPATLDTVEEWGERARAAHAEFMAAAPAARSTVLAARGSAPGSNAWSNAQVALGGLEARRSAAMVAMAELDRIYVETSSRGEAIAPVEAVHQQVTALIAQQDALIDELISVVGT